MAQRKTWGERFREAFIYNATKRGFKNVEFREENGVRQIYCDDGRKGFGIMDDANQVTIARYVEKNLDKIEDQMVSRPL
jgi:hypothetical protein